MANLKGLLFTESHEWIEFIDDTRARVGITDYAQKALGDLVFINLPEVGDTISIGESFADVESVKAVSEVFSPVHGVVSAINDELLDSPELVNQEAYEAWLIEVKEITAKEDFLTADEYELLISKEE